MRLLLDTHAFLWWVAGEDRLGVRARRAMADPETECLLSLASVWEMAVKISLGKLRITGELGRFVSEHLAANAFRALPIDIRHAARVATLPFHHRDPFDRLLAAQAIEEAVGIVSADRVFAQYGVTRVW